MVSRFCQNLTEITARVKGRVGLDELFEELSNSWEKEAEQEKSEGVKRV